MRKLTSHQIALLEFFHNGGVVCFCTTVSSQLGVYHFPLSKPEKFSKTIFYSLLRIGLLKAMTEEIEFGIRWSSFSISEKGTELLQDREVEDEKA